MPQRLLFIGLIISALLTTGGTARAADIVVPPPLLRTYIPLLPVQVVEPQTVLPFGISIEGDTDGYSGYLDGLETKAVKWVRIPIHWREVEPVDTQPDDYRWDSADQAVALAIDLGSDVIITHQSAPEWAASSRNGPIEKAPLEEAAEYLSALAERYDGDGINDAAGSPTVRHFELYEALDYGVRTDDKTRWDQDGMRYAEFLEAVYPTIKAANPDAQVIFGGIEHQFKGDGRSVLVDVLANGYADYFDMLALHVHPSLNRHLVSSSGGVGVLEKATAVRRLMNIYGVHKPLIITKAWLTPLDLPADQRNEFQRIQSSYLVQVIVQSLATSVEATIWHDDHEQDIGPDQVQPSVLAYRALIKQLGDSKYEGMVPQQGNESTTEVHIFEADGYKIHVAWINPLGTEKSNYLLLAGSRATVFDLFGNPVQIVSDNVSENLLHIGVGSEPRYVHVWE